jgi:hypothetical protein
MKLTWSWCMILRICCWIQIAVFYWGFLHLCSLKSLVFNSLFCFVLVQFWDEYNTGFIQWVWQCSFLLWKSIRRVDISPSLKVWWNSEKNTSGPGLFFYGRIFIDASISLHVIDKFWVTDILLIQFWMFICI